MAGLLAVFDAKELILVIIALGGLVPVAVQYRKASTWFALGYLMLVVAAIATNLEEVALGNLLNIIEHGAGLMGSAIIFAVAAYMRRQQVIKADDEVTTADG